jgi:polyhydroxyalkanoate synthesis regulator phasin
MSASNAAAIRRRAANVNQEQVQPTPVQETQQSTTTRPKTVTELVVQLNSRVNELEQKVDISGNNIPDNLQNIIQEYNMRFDIIAEEISVLKDTVLKLQTYTMDVNKMLLNERIQILSDVSTNKPLHIENIDTNKTNLLTEISLDQTNSVDIQSLVNEKEE